MNTQSPVEYPAEENASPHPDLVPLGATPIMISPLGLGTWQWGDRMFWNYGQGYAESDVRDAFDISVEAGINFFDTAEVYGTGRSERFLGQFLKAEKPASQPVERLVIATKFMPLPYRLTRGAMKRALQGSLERLELSRVDLYQIHWPMPPVSIETWANALADVVEAGLTVSVGVSNYNADQMRRAHRTLKERGMALTSNQVEYSLLHRSPELAGLLALCKELNITLIAYSPIAKGVLTGKYTPKSPMPGMRSRAYSVAYLAKVQPLIRRMREIGQERGGKTPSQVALNWVICKGAVAIPGAKNAHQAQENAGALGWRLDEGEIADLDRLSEDLEK